MIINEEVRGGNPSTKRSETSKIYSQSIHNNISFSRLVYKSKFLEGHAKREEIAHFGGCIR